MLSEACHHTTSFNNYKFQVVPLFKHGWTSNQVDRPFLSVVINGLIAPLCEVYDRGDAHIVVCLISQVVVQLARFAYLLIYFLSSKRLSPETEYQGRFWKPMEVSQ